MATRKNLMRLKREAPPPSLVQPPRLGVSNEAIAIDQVAVAGAERTAVRTRHSRLVSISLDHSRQSLLGTLREDAIENSTVSSVESQTQSDEHWIARV